MLLSVRGLTVSIAGSQIINKISLHVDKNELVTLVGRNGAGKTTTLKTIMGIIKPQEGEVLLDGVNITGMKPHRIAQLGIGFSPEDRRIFSDLTVEENIRLVMQIAKGLAKKKREEYEEEAVFETIYEVLPELRDIKDRKGLYLSGGQQRMLSIARILALKPKLLLLDEPLEGLSPIVVSRLLRSIEKIRRNVSSVLLAESNFHAISKLSSKCYVIERGEILYEGETESILKDKRVLQTIGVALEDVN